MCEEPWSESISFKHSPIPWQPIDFDEAEEFVSQFKEQLRQEYIKSMLEQITGPVLYGEGNFDVVKDEDGEWTVVPKPDLEGETNG